MLEHIISCGSIFITVISGFTYLFFVVVILLFILAVIHYFTITFLPFFITKPL